MLLARVENNSCSGAVRVAGMLDVVCSCVAAPAPAVVPDIEAPVVEVPVVEVPVADVRGMDVCGADASFFIAGPACVGVTAPVWPVPIWPDPGSPDGAFAAPMPDDPVPNGADWVMPFCAGACVRID